MTTVLISVLFLLVACLLAACVLSDALLQRLATAVRGAPLEPRLLLTVRKVGYVVLVLYLFTWAFAWRRLVVDVSAAQYATREQSRGDVHLTGALVRLGLGGFRGVTTCYLWNLAIDKQMKNQLNELEVIVGWLTELQPHFNTPWLFQSWNLAYNVSNKTDRVSDKYFYVTRGIRLLADGERQNNDDPDLRFELAATYQHKICQSDETNVHRSLYQLSLIPPHERDPARFRLKSGDRQKIDMAEFGKFCEKHPQLIRRLREGIHKDSLFEQRRLFTCSTPAAVVQFLADNYRIPSLYREGRPTPPGGKWVEKADEKADLDPDTLERFPVLPPPRAYGPESPLHLFLPYDDMKDGDLTDQSPNDQDLDSWDGFLMARAWYSYAQEPLPDPREDLPGEPKPITDRIHQRMNRRMTTLIFRHYPARAQSYIAERLEEEGWFDDAGWSLADQEWFAHDVLLGKDRKWAETAWGEAFKMWQAHGQRNHLLMSPEEEANRRQLVEKYRAQRHLNGPTVPEREDSTDPEIQEGWKAARYMYNYDSYRGVSNFPHHYNRSFVEQDPKTVTARKSFYEAEALATTGSTFLALKKYQDPEALATWAAVLENHPDFRRDELIQEESDEIQLSYLDVLNRALPANEVKTQLGAAALAGSGAAGWLNATAAVEVRHPERFPGLTITRGPFDRMDKDGNPWIPTSVAKRVLERRRKFQPRKKDTDEGGAAKTPSQAAPQAPDAKPS